MDACDSMHTPESDSFLPSKAINKCDLFLYSEPFCFCIWTFLTCIYHVCVCPMQVCVYIYTYVCLKPSVIPRKTNMRAVNKWFIIHFLLLLSTYSQKSDVVLAEWCIADEQTPDSELQVGLDWACGRGGANCSKIQVGQACFRPNTVRAHASYAFNNYYQKLKRRGGTCYFKGAAITTDLDPSYNSCNYELTP